MLDYFPPKLESEQNTGQIPSCESEQKKQNDETEILGFKLQMTQAAICHEYARTEYDKTLCVMRRGELQNEMGVYQQNYLEARAYLQLRDASQVEALEHEIRTQKQLVIQEFHA